MGNFSKATANLDNHLKNINEDNSPASGKRDTNQEMDENVCIPKSSRNYLNERTNKRNVGLQEILACCAEDSRESEEVIEEETVEMESSEENCEDEHSTL